MQKKVMYKYNNNRRLSLRRPKNSKELQELVKFGYCVKNLNEQLMKEYLGFYQLTLKEFFEKFSWRELEFVAPDIRFKDGVNENRKISLAQGKDYDFVIPRGMLKDVFEQELASNSYFFHLFF
jgi:hypothetical protein